MIEIPRQQQEGGNEPEILQFRASQKLRNLNDGSERKETSSSTKSQQQQQLAKPKQVTVSLTLL